MPISISALADNIRSITPRIPLPASLRRNSGLLSFGRDARGIGIDLGTKRLKIAVIIAGDPTPSVERLVDLPLPQQLVRDGRIVDAAGLAEEVSRAADEAQIQRGPAVIGLGHDLYLRRVTLQRSSVTEALRQAVSQGETIGIPRIDQDVDKMVLDILDPVGSGPSMQVLVGITKKESVALVQRISLDAGFDIDGVDPDPMAAYNLLMACKPERRMPRTTLLVIGSTRSWVVASEQGMPIAVREIDVGVQKLIDNLTSGGLMSPEHAEKTIFTTAEPGAIHPEGFRAWGEEVIEQLARSVPATRDGGVATGRLYLSGGGAQVPGLAAVLMAAAAPDHVDVETFDPLMSLTGPGASGHRDGPIYTVALGLALRGLDR